MTGQGKIDQQCNVITLLFWIQHFYSATNNLVLRAKQGPMSETCLQEEGVRCGQSLQADGRSRSVN